MATDHARDVHAPDAYWEDDRLILRASSLGSCTGALVRCSLGITPAPPPADIETRWAQGVVAEPIILGEVRRRGWKSDDQFSYPAVAWDDHGGTIQPLVELHVGKVTIRCHPDAIGHCYIGRPQVTSVTTEGVTSPVPAWQKVGDRRVVEAKALRPSFPRNFPPYLWQMSVEMAGTGLPGLWAYGSKDEEGVVDPAGVELVPVDVPPYSIVDIKRRALTIYKAAVARHIPECDRRQFPCGYYTDPDALCGQKKGDDVEPFPEDVADKARILIDEYHGAKLRFDDAKGDLDRIKGMLKDLVDKPDVAAGTRYGEGGVTVGKVAKMGNVDWAKAEKDGIDIDKYRKPGTTYWEVR